jgi:hypothetical protein
MNIRERTARQTTRPASLSIDHNAGKLQAKEAAMQGALALVALLVGTMGGGLVLVAAANLGGGAGYWLLLAFGGSVSVVGIGFGGVSAWLTVAGWVDYRRWLQQCRDSELWAYEQAQGLEVDTEVRETELRTEDIRDVLIAVVMIHRLAQQGTETPWSVRRLEGPVFVGGVRAGDVSKGTAEELGAMFARLGLVAGRAERRAGRWVPASLDEAVDCVVENWNRRHS